MSDGCSAVCEGEVMRDLFVHDTAALRTTGKRRSI
jgi:hypothetical protein